MTPSIGLTDKNDRPKIDKKIEGAYDALEKDVEQIKNEVLEIERKAATQER